MDNKLKINNLFKKFPWLKYLVKSPADWDDISVQRINQELLEITPKAYYNDGYNGVTESEDFIYLIYPDRIIEIEPEVTEIESEGKKRLMRSWKGEKVIDAISRFGKGLEAIFRKNYYLSDWKDEEYDRKLSGIIYWIPKNPKLLPKSLRELWAAE